MRGSVAFVLLYASPVSNGEKDGRQGQNKQTTKARRMKEEEHGEEDERDVGQKGEEETSFRLTESCGSNDLEWEGGGEKEWEEIYSLRGYQRLSSGGMVTAAKQGMRKLT